MKCGKCQSVAYAGSAVFKEAKVIKTISVTIISAKKSHAGAVTDALSTAAVVHSPHNVSAITPVPSRAVAPPVSPVVSSTTLQHASSSIQLVTFNSDR